MGYGGHQLRLKCAQVHHQSPAGTFSRVPGRCLHWSPNPPQPRWPPAVNIILIWYNIIYFNLIYNMMSHERSFSFVQTFHTHTPCLWQAFGRVVSGHMRWKWGWEGGWWWDESEDEMKDYLTGTRGGERKRRGKEQTHTNTPGPERANAERARKTEADGHGTRPAEGGGRRKRLNQPDTAKTYAYLGTRRTQPT